MFDFPSLDALSAMPGNAAEALPGRAEPVNPHPAPHPVLGTLPLTAPAPGQGLIYLASGCYWGAEELYWKAGAVSTAVGFMGGFTPNPTYAEVCTGRTGHAETVRVVYSEDSLPLAELLQLFFESHDPTTANRQGNDVGTQYRSAIFTTTPEQATLASSMLHAYQEVLTAAGKGEITTELRSASEAGPFYLAEEEHQAYLFKVPHGYRCHARTGLPCPLPGAGPLAAGN
ncbi:methionine sulfoxide reductase A [Actinobaculum suis]|uniref:Peptide methionine sulfoxide reductase MsrA n=1 Tax=Actinobaculum suis TaxID=1657 RepID=A0A7Z9C7Y1_9ACTO|nr:peptide-methionine (S)-S-oxide reductase MsrA [Actinobaculum suis]VDG75861.1 methionine sulfoxide reductase A [Actinobaculum suis]